MHLQGKELQERVIGAELQLLFSDPPSYYVLGWNWIETVGFSALGTLYIYLQG